MCGYFIHCYAAVFLHDGFNCCSGLWCHYSMGLTGWRRVCYRTNDVHELPTPLVHFHLSMNFDGFHPCFSAVLLWSMLQAGPPSLHYCAVVLHSCIVLPPVGHSSNHQYHCCQLTDNRAVFRIFIALLRFSFDSPS